MKRAMDLTLAVEASSKKLNEVERLLEDSSKTTSKFIEDIRSKVNTLHMRTVKVPDEIDLINEEVHSVARTQTELYLRVVNELRSHQSRLDKLSHEVEEMKARIPEVKSRTDDILLASVIVVTIVGTAFFFVS